MSFGNTFENDLLKLIFNATTIDNIAQDDTTSPNTQLFFSLHTADPAEAGTQQSSEVTYTGYGTNRVGVNRTTGGFTVTNNEVVNVGTISFGQRTDAGAAESVVFVGVGDTAAVASAGKLIARMFCGDIATRLPFTAATDDNITIPGNPFAVDDRIVFMADVVASLPTGITGGTIYWVKTSSGNVITVSTTQGGATVDVTAAGSGIAGKVIPLSVTQNVTPQIAAGQFKFRLD